MSFSEFLQWIRNYFSSSSASNSNPGSSTAGTNVPTKAESPSSSSSSPSSGVSGTPVLDTTSSSDTVSSTVATEIPSAEPSTGTGSISPPPLPASPVTTVTTSPNLSEASEPTAPVISQPVQSPPVIERIDTEDSKVALNKDIIFQIVTNPANQYENCTLDLGNANNASVVQDIDPVTGQFSLRFNKASSSDNDTQLIKARNPQGESSTAVNVSQMKLFWHNHPGRKNVCDETLFVNQCAIRMGRALELSGIKLSEDRRVLRRCTTEYRAFKHHKEDLVKGHVLAAQELANWIKSQRSTFGDRSIVHSQEEILGRSGLIFFRDGWGATDHIDVWDGQSLAGGFPSYFDSDFKELWFWDVY